jgi:hypothetical protein
MALGIVKYQPGRTALAIAQPKVTPTPVRTNRPRVDPAPDIPTGIVINTGSGSSAATAAVRKAELEYKKTQDAAAAKAAAAALERQQAGAAAQRDALLKQIASAGSIDPTLAKTLDEQKAAQEKYIADQYAQQVGQLGKAYETGANLQTQGFDALRNYLQRNAPTAYANAPRATAPSVSNDLAQYMTSRGVEAQRAEPGLLAARAALEGGATNYNNLLNVLAGQSAAGQESRLAEEQMARQLAAAQLGAYKAQQEGTLTTQQLSALQEIQNQYNTAKFNAQQQAIARQQALQDALNSLYGTGYTTPPPVAPQEPQVDQSILDALANLDLSGINNIGGFVGSR